MSVLDPAPSDSADFERISCRASEAAMNSVSSTSAEPGNGVRMLMRRGINGVRSLYGGG